jgi:hypothetical protein
MTTISRGASNTDRWMSDDDQPGSEDRLRSQVATLRGPYRDAEPSCFAVLARSLEGGHAGDRRVVDSGSVTRTASTLRTVDEVTALLGRLRAVVQFQVCPEGTCTRVSRDALRMLSTARSSH